MGKTRNLGFVALAVAVLIWAAPFAAEAKKGVAMAAHKMNLEQTVGPELFKAAGLGSLSAGGQQLLADWIERRMAQTVEHAMETCREHGPDASPTWQTPDKK